MRPWIAAGLALAASIIPPADAQQGGPGPAMLLKQEVEGMPRGERQEVRVFAATLPPGGRTPFHTHRHPVTVYTIEGAFTLEMEGRAPVTVRAGETMVEPPNVRMTGYNRSTTETARLVIFYVSEPGAPFLDMAH